MTHRCNWVSAGASPQYVQYHDEEWGVPSRDDQHLFEMLVLEGAQAGLSWSTILNKREGYRRAFASFDIARVARFTPRHVETLVQDASIVRNRAKIEAAIVNALLAAETMTGRDGITAHKLDHDRLLEIMARYGRGPSAAATGSARQA